MNNPWVVVLAVLLAVGGAALGVLQWRLVCRLRHHPNSEVAVHLPGLALSWVLGWTVGWVVSWTLASAVREAIAGTSVDMTTAHSLIRHGFYSNGLDTVGLAGWSLGRLGVAGAEWVVRRRQIGMRFRDWLLLHLFGCWLWVMGYGMGEVGISVGLSTDLVTTPLLIWAAGLVVVGGLAGALSILGLREDVYLPWYRGNP
jgi:hypothetical protein